MKTEKNEQNINNFMSKQVYISISADLIHHGIINILNEAAKYGDVTVGLLTDAAIAAYKRLPFMTYDERKRVIESLKPVKRVVIQESLDSIPNIDKYQPDYIIHGDDWKESFQKTYRKKLLNYLKSCHGKIKLIEVPYTKGISGTLLHEALHEIGTTPERRLVSLRRLLVAKPLLKICEVHSALTGSIVENTKVTTDLPNEFDGMWASSLTDSTMRAMPDIEAVDISSRLRLIDEIFEVTTKPLIFDGDTGGIPEHFKFTVRQLERLGVSAVIIEDKTGLKKNSLFGNEVSQTQDSIDNFCQKIRVGKQSQITEDFMIIARIESLILEKGIDDALNRAKAYIDAGADGIMIHSRKKDPAEIFSFCDKYRSLQNRKPLVVVSSSFNQVTENELQNHGVNIVIYANQLLRAAYPAMKHVAESILIHHRSLECDKQLMSIKEILDLIPGTR